jgi:hypothetical protein
MNSLVNYVNNYDLHACKLYLPVYLLFYFTYPLVKKTLHNKYEKFRWLEEDKKNYIVKNIIKSGALSVLCVASIPTIIIPVITTNTWSNYWCYRLGILYTANDTMGLLLVNNLPKTTQYHHKITTILGLVSLGVDFQNSYLGQMMFVYTLCSAASFLVNYYLGIRYLYEKGNNKMLKLKKNARNIYLMSCAVNWGWHLQWIFNNYTLIEIQHIIYFLLLIFIVKDDLILLNWLNN